MEHFIQYEILILTEINNYGTFICSNYLEETNLTNTAETFKI